MKTDLTREELIKLLQQQDAEIRAYQIEDQDRARQVHELEIELIKKQKEFEDKIFQERKFEEQRNMNLLQKYASEANIFKGNIEKSTAEMSEIDKQLLELIDDTKRRVNKLASQFLDLSKEKNAIMIQNEFDSRNDIADDLRLLQRSYSASINRSQKIIESEMEKDRQTHKNVELLTRTIDLALLNNELRQDEQGYNEGQEGQYNEGQYNEGQYNEGQYNEDQEYYQDQPEHDSNQNS